MLSMRITAALLALALLSTGCAVAPHQALDPELRGKVASADVVAGIPQREVFAQINVSNMAAGVGGALFVLIDAGINASRTSDAEERVKPLRDALLGYDFDGTVKANLDRALRAAPALRARPAVVIKDVSETSYRARLDTSTAASVLLLTTDYYLTPNFDGVSVGMRAFLMPRIAALNKGKVPESTGLDVGEAIYRNTLVFTATLPGATTQADANRTNWQADNGQLLRNSISLGAIALADALAADLNGTAAAEAGKVLPPGVSQARAKNGTLSLSAVATAEPVQRALLPTPTAVTAGLTAAPVPPPAPTAIVTPPPTAVPVAATTAVVTAPVTPAVAAPAAAPMPATGLMTAAATTLRLRPTLDSVIVNTLPADTAVQNQGSTHNPAGDWIYIQAGPYRGWVRAEELVRR